MIADSVESLLEQLTMFGLYHSQKLLLLRYATVCSTTRAKLPIAVEIPRIFVVVLVVVVYLFILSTSSSRTLSVPSFTL